MNVIDILLVDDSPAFNHLTKLTLNKANVPYTIAEISNGQKALHHLASHDKCPDVILLDVNMPVMDGFDFLQEYQQEHKCVERTLIYMLTSSVQEVDKTKAYSFGLIKDYFEKPLTPENVNKILNDLGAELV
jgi:CheY-like chemotaxis protein